MTKLAARIAIVLAVAVAAFPLGVQARHGGGGGGFHAGGGFRGAFRGGGHAGFHSTARFHSPARFHSRTHHALRTRHAVRSRRAAHRSAAAHIRHARVQRNARNAARTRHARFASAFAKRNRAYWRNGRRWWWANRAWRYGALAAFVPWYGPLFWPYAYADLFDYAFWPYGYYDGYWAYAYDGFFDGMFWGPSTVPEAYAYAPARRHRTARSAAAPAATEQQVRQLCDQPGNGITAWPISEIEHKVGLNDEQRQLLEDVWAAGENAAEAVKNACPAQAGLPLTPPGRLQAIRARLEAIREAVTAVEPAVDKFYASLNDRQKQAFDEIGPRRARVRPEDARASADIANSCKQPKPGLANLPIERIKDAINPTGEQAAALQKLQDASGKAVSILEDACPNRTPRTPPGRLQAMDARLKAMLDAADTLKGPLDDFYASLRDEQKARVNRIGSESAQARRND